MSDYDYRQMYWVKNVVKADSKTIENEIFAVDEVPPGTANATKYTALDGSVYYYNYANNNTKANWSTGSISYWDPQQVEALRQQAQEVNKIIEDVGEDVVNDLEG